MATYKKRGYKPKTKVEVEVQEEFESTTAEVFNTLDDSASKSEEWVAKNQKYIFGGIGALALILLLVVGYNRLVTQPNNMKGANDMYQAQQYFDSAIETSNDSLFNLALNGGNGKFGFLDIIDNYEGTKAGNLANYYTGISYLNLKDYSKAIEYLSKFESDDLILSAISKGAIGDAFIQIDQTDDALDFYEKAIHASENSYTTPMYLMKAGLVALELKDNSLAEKYFTRIKKEFGSSDQAKNIDAFITRSKYSK